MQYLLESGAGIHFVNYHMQEPLYHCNFASIDAAKLLVGHGANNAAFERVGNHILFLVVAKILGRAVSKFNCCQQC